MDIHTTKQQLQDTRRLTHTLAGLITAMSYGLHCTRLSSDLESAMEAITGVENVVFEAESVVSDLRASLREMAAELDNMEQ